MSDLLRSARRYQLDEGSELLGALATELASAIWRADRRALQRLGSSGEPCAIDLRELAAALADTVIDQPLHAQYTESAVLRMVLERLSGGGPHRDVDIAVDLGLLSPNLDAARATLYADELIAIDTDLQGDRWWQLTARGRLLLVVLAAREHSHA